MKQTQKNERRLEEEKDEEYDGDTDSICSVVESIDSLESDMKCGTNENDQQMNQRQCTEMLRKLSCNFNVFIP